MSNSATTPIGSFTSDTTGESVSGEASGADQTVARTYHVDEPSAIPSESSSDGEADCVQTGGMGALPGTGARVLIANYAMLLQRAINGDAPKSFELMGVPQASLDYLFVLARATDETHVLNRMNNLNGEANAFMQAVFTNDRRMMARILMK